MAGKLSLSIIVAVALFLFGYKVCELKTQQELEKTAPKLPFKIARVVNDGDTRAASGMKPPFTVLVYEGPYVQQILPGELGPIGKEFYLPDPRHSSESTIVP